MTRRGNIAGIATLGMWMTLALIVANTGNIPPFQLTAFVTGVGGASIALIELVRGRNLSLLSAIPARVIAFGTIGIGGYTLLFLAGMKLASPFTANALNYTWPLFLTIFFHLATRTKPTAFEVIGLMLGLFGATLIFSSRSAGLSEHPHEVAGWLCALTGAILWGAYCVRTRTVKYPVMAMAVFFLITAAICTLLHLCFEETRWPETPLAWIALTLLALMRISYALWDYAMKEGDQKFLASLSYFVPVGSMGLLVLGKQAPLNPVLWLAALLVVLGSLVGNFDKLKQLYLRRSSRIV